MDERKPTPPAFYHRVKRDNYLPTDLVGTDLGTPVTVLVLRLPYHWRRLMSLTNPPSSSGGPLTTSSIRHGASTSLGQNLNVKRSVQPVFDGNCLAAFLFSYLLYYLLRIIFLSFLLSFLDIGNVLFACVLLSVLTCVTDEKFVHTLGHHLCIWFRHSPLVFKLILETPFPRLSWFGVWEFDYTHLSTRSCLAEISLRLWKPSAIDTIVVNPLSTVSSSESRYCIF